MTSSRLDTIEDALCALLVADPTLAGLVQLGQPAQIPNELVWIPGNAETEWLGEEPAATFVEDGSLEIHVVVFRGGDKFKTTRNRAQVLTDAVTNVLASERTISGTCSDAYVESVTRDSGLTANGRGIEMTIRVKLEADLLGAPEPPPIDVTVCGPGEIPIPSSIAADESVDVSTDLNAFFNGLPPDAIVCCDPTAKYLLTGTLDIDLTNIGRLTVNQNGALFHWPTLGPLVGGISQRNHVKLTNGEPIWNDLNILGPYGSTTRPVFSHIYEGENGLILAGTHDAVITRPVIHGTAGDGMGTSKYHPPVGPTVFCTNTRILFPTVGSCAGGFADSHGSELGPLYIEDGDFRHISRSGLDFEYPASNIFIRRNRFADLGLSWVAMAGIGVLSTVEISDNVVEDAPLFAKVGPGPGTYASGGRDSGFLIQRNQSLVVVSPGLGPVMSFKGVSDVTLIGNIQHFSAPRSAGAIQPAGTVAPLDVNFHAQDNDFAGVGTLYASPTDPTWYDDGGNIL